MDAQGPLTGFRVIEFCSTLSGPLATMLLADQGADVIKVETPQGDQARQAGPAAPGDLVTRRRHVTCLEDQWRSSAAISPGSGVGDRKGHGFFRRKHLTSRRRGAQGIGDGLTSFAHIINASYDGSRRGG